MARLSPSGRVLWQPWADRPGQTVGKTTTAFKTAITRGHRCLNRVADMEMVALVPRLAGQAIIRGWGLVWVFQC